jgi:G3E family GTPase
MRVILLSGFLGSGKTTLLRRLLREAPAEWKLGVIVNDVSDLEVDGDLVREAERLSEAEGTLVSLFAGSISGDKRQLFQQTLATFAARGDLTHLLIEASGSSHPLPLIEDVQAQPGLIIQAFITLLDARAMIADQAGGLDLLRTLVKNQDQGRRSTENLLAEQLQFASHLVLTKTERLSASDLAVIRQTLAILHPQATVLTASYGQTQLNLLTADGFDPDRVQQLAAAIADPAVGETAPYDIGHTLVCDRRPLHPQRLWTHFRERLGLGIHRSKGFIWLVSRPEQVLLWNQSGGSIELELLAYWKAALVSNPEGRLLPEEITLLREQLKDTDPVFGDRMTELTVIGTAADRTIFVRGLHACFCTEEEVEQWQAGATFTDPWPSTLRRVR